VNGYGSAVKYVVAGLIALLPPLLAVLLWRAPQLGMLIFLFTATWAALYLRGRRSASGA